MPFKACQVEEIRHLIQEYTQTLSSPFDAFLEEHILSSKFYVILNESNEIGYYAIHHGDHGQLMTQFYVRPSYLMTAQDLFDQVIKEYNVESLFVPTCDELFVSLAIDKDYPISKQAYFFQDSRLELMEKQSLSGDFFGPATLDDLLHIQEMCGDFLDQYETRIRNGELFCYYRGSVLLGVGVVERSKLLEGIASIGMFTNENYRKQGIGRDIILKLRKWCYSQQLTPICGCWYYNEASKRTLESAGMITRTRLLNIRLC